MQRRGRGLPPHAHSRGFHVVFGAPITSDGPRIMIGTRPGSMRGRRTASNPTEGLTLADALAALFTGRMLPNQRDMDQEQLNAIAAQIFEHAEPIQHPTARTALDALKPRPITDSERANQSADPIDMIDFEPGELIVGLPCEHLVCAG